MILSRNSTEKPLNKYSNTNWSETVSSDLRLIKSDKSITFDAVPEIKKLVRKLAKIAGVKRVKAVATKFPDIHCIDFELMLQAHTELSDQVWDKVQDLVIDCEWNLRDASGEKWYFRPQVVDRFSQLGDASEVADSESGIQTWSSPPLKLVAY